MSGCEFCGRATPRELEVQRFGSARADVRNDNWWVCEPCQKHRDNQHRVIDKRMCNGCEDDFYNGNNSYGITECWSFKTATTARYQLVHINHAPPYKTGQFDFQLMPNCYRRKQFVKVKPEALDSRGYWKS